MSTEVKHRRGTTAQHAAFTGAQGEITIDTDRKVAVVHDGSTVGGYPALKEADLASGALRVARSYAVYPEMFGGSVAAMIAAYNADSSILLMIIPGNKAYTITAAQGVTSIRGGGTVVFEPRFALTIDGFTLQVAARVVISDQGFTFLNGGNVSYTGVGHNDIGGAESRRTKQPTGAWAIDLAWGPVFESSYDGDLWAANGEPVPWSISTWAAAAGMKLGTMIPCPTPGSGGQWDLQTPSVYAIINQFSGTNGCYVLENYDKWNFVEATQGAPDYTNSDAAWAVLDNGTLAGERHFHAVNYPYAQPQWVTDSLVATPAKTNADALMDYRATTLAAKYADGHFAVADGVNEIVDEFNGDGPFLMRQIKYTSGVPTAGGWYEAYKATDPTIAHRWWHRQFTAMKALWPSTKLAWKMFSMEAGSQGTSPSPAWGYQNQNAELKARQIMEFLIWDAIQQGVPVDLVSWQLHLHPWFLPDLQGIRGSLSFLEALGVGSVIGEANIAMLTSPYLPSNSTRLAAKGAKYFEDMVRIFLTYSKISHFLQWGPFGAAEMPLIWTYGNPMFRALARALNDAVPVASRTIPVVNRTDLRIFNIATPTARLSWNTTAPNTSTNGIQVASGDIARQDYSWLVGITNATQVHRMQVTLDTSTIAAGEVLFCDSNSDGTKRIKISIENFSGSLRFALTVHNGDASTPSVAATPFGPVSVQTGATYWLAFSWKTGLIGASTGFGESANIATTVPTSRDRRFFGTDWDGSNRSLARIGWIETAPKFQFNPQLRLLAAGPQPAAPGMTQDIGKLFLDMWAIQ